MQANYYGFSPSNNGALPELFQINEQTHIREGEKDKASPEEEEKDKRSSVCPAGC